MSCSFRVIVTRLPSPAGNHPGQGEVYIALPGGWEGGGPLVLALHGSGREALSYRDVPFYARQRDIALHCGCCFAAVSNGPDTYGLDPGFDNVCRLHELMSGEYGAGPVALWGSSAGGLMMHRFFRAHPGRVAALLGTFPVYDPLAMPPLPSLLRAFGAADREELRQRAAFLSPQSVPPEIYEGKTIAISHGVDDAAVPIEQSRAFCRTAGRYAASVTLAEKPDGHSTGNFALYDTPAFARALTALRDGLAPIG